MTRYLVASMILALGLLTTCGSAAEPNGFAGQSALFGYDQIRQVGCESGNCDNCGPVYGGYGGPVGQPIAAQPQPSAATPVAQGPIYGPSPFIDAQPCAAPVMGCEPVAACCPKWFGGIYGMAMDRQSEDDFFFAFDPALPSRRYLKSQFADMDASGGVELRAGRTFCNCNWGLEFVYWGLFPDDQVASITPANIGGTDFNLALDMQDVQLDLFDPLGAPFRDTITNYFNDPAYPIQRMSLQRSYDYHNFEINLISGPLYRPSACGGCAATGGLFSGPSLACGSGLGRCGCGRTGCGGCGAGGACGGGCGPPRLNVGWAFGVRYFKADELLSLAVDGEDGLFYVGDPSNEFFYDVEAENEMVGAQLGLNLDYRLTRCLSVEAGTKFGVYGNHASIYQGIYNEYGAGIIVPDGVNEVEYWVRESDTDISFLGELRAGIGYKFGSHWRLSAGYRAMGVTGIATPVGQIPSGRGFATDWPGVNNSSHLVLHGSYAGLEFAW